MKYFIVALMLIAGSAHAVEKRDYSDVSYNGTDMAIIKDPETGVTCFIVESSSNNSSPVMQCFTKSQLEE